MKALTAVLTIALLPTLGACAYRPYPQRVVVKQPYRQRVIVQRPQAVVVKKRTVVTRY